MKKYLLEELEERNDHLFGPELTNNFVMFCFKFMMLTMNYIMYVCIEEGCNCYILYAIKPNMHLVLFIMFSCLVVKKYCLLIKNYSF